VDTVTLECKQVFYDNGQIRVEQYKSNGQFHNPNGVAYRSWHENGQKKSEGYWLDGELHNFNGVAMRICLKNGEIFIEQYWVNGIQLTKEQFDHRNSKPCNNKTVEVDGVKYKLKAI